MKGAGSGTRPAAAADRARPGGGTATKGPAPAQKNRSGIGTGTKEPQRDRYRHKAPQRDRHRHKSTAAGSGWLRGRRGCDPPRKDTARARRIPGPRPDPAGRVGVPGPPPAPPLPPWVFTFIFEL